MPQTCFVLSPMRAVRHADISLSVHVQGHVTDLAEPLGSLETEKNSSTRYQSVTKIKLTMFQI